MFPTLAWSVALRAAQVAVEAAPTILFGLLIAGVLRRMVGPAGTRRLFGGEGFVGLLRAWALGMLLPVCSLGVIPVARELRRAGVAGGPILAFVLVAPLLNPISFLYGLTLSDPLVICVFAASSLALALAAGEAWERLYPSPEVEVPAEAQPPYGLKRLLAVVAFAGREGIGPALAFMVAGVTASGLLAAAIPFGKLQATMSHADLTSPLLMAVVAFPAYASPLNGMMKLGLMFEHGNSVGAAFVLFVLGIGANVGLVWWVLRHFGLRPAGVWFVLTVGLTIGLGYAFEKPLYFAAHEESHTHAFDDFSAPYPAGTEVTFAEVWPKLTQRVGVLEGFSLLCIAGLMIGGLTLQCLDGRVDVDGWLTRGGDEPAETAGKPIWARPIPGPVLGAVALAGLVGFSIAGAYIYYPAPSEVFEQMTHVRADALTAVNVGAREEAIRRVQQWDLLTRKLQVGVFIRTGRIDPAMAEAAEKFRETLEQMRDALLAEQMTEAHGMRGTVEVAYRKLKATVPTEARQRSETSALGQAP